MTIKERYAKYTNSQLEKGIANLKSKLAEDERDMEKFKAANDVEFFNIAKEQHDEHFQLLLDAEAALAGRM